MEHSLSELHIFLSSFQSLKSLRRKIMAMIPLASSTVMFSFKVFLISSTVLSAAIMLKIFFPAIEEFAVYELPSVYNGVISWLRPPYLHLVFNGIIITIVASFKLQSRKDDASPPPPPTQPLPTMDDEPPPPLPIQLLPTMDDEPPPPPPIQPFLTMDAEPPPPQPLAVGAMDLTTSQTDYDLKVEKGSDSDGFEVFIDASRSTKTEQTVSGVDSVDGGVALVEDPSSNKENEYVNSKSSLITTWINNTTEHSSSNSKPPVSVRFGHRRNAKTSPDGKEAALAVSRPKRNDTLESTWKTITEGRPVPLTRHLRKSDTWERDSHGRPPRAPPEKIMTKSETFQEAVVKIPSPSPDGGRLVKKEASLSQEELNKRVEAFINKFNEEMRLQRQESLYQYREMIKRGSD